MTEEITDLEVFVDQMIEQARAEGYVPSGFLQTRYRDGVCQTATAIAKLVKSTKIQSGLIRLNEIGLIHMSLEAAVLKFPDEFTPEVQIYAKHRLEEVSRN